MGAASRRKGATYEREIANAFRAAGIPARRGGHRQSQAEDDASDVVLAGPLHIEAKRCERLAVPAWLRQAVRDCAPGRVPAVVFRRSREKSWAIVPLEYLIALHAQEDGES